MEVKMEDNENDEFNERIDWIGEPFEW